MSLKKSLITSTALAAFALPAYADISPDQVWTMMQDYYTNAGLTVTADREESGKDLTLRDVTITFPNDSGDTVLTIPEIQLEADGDEVTMTMAETMTATIPTSAMDGTGVTSDMTLTQKDLVAQISGDPDDMVIDFDLPEMTAELTTTEAPATEGAVAVPVVMRLAMENMRGSETVKTGAATAVTSDFEIAKVSYTATGSGGDEAGTFTSSGEMADVAVKFDMNMPEDAAAANLIDALGMGLRISGDLKSGTSTGSNEADGPMGPMKTTSKAEMGALSFAVDQDGARINSTSAGVTVDAEMPMLPFPIHAEMSRMVGGFDVPLVPGEESSPFGLEVRLEDLVVNDEVWAMFDPTAHLPRSPATVILDLEGMAKVTGTLENPEEVMASEKPPFEIESLSLNELQVKLMGADLTGKGAATFDNSTPVPMPTGAVDLRLEGGNTLIDNLVATGLIPSDQLMGIRMMLGLFAVPAGDDVMTSKIEMRDDGGVYANGQRLR